MTTRLLLLALLACDAGKPADDSTPTGSGDADTDADTDADADADTDTDTGLPEGASCVPTSDACGEGLACCTACCGPEATPVCTVEDVYGACPLPDLVVDGKRMDESVYIETAYFEEDSCAIVEGCVDGPGWRRLLRFETTTPNMGTADLHFGAPTDSNLFVYSECHDHFHFDNYLSWRLLAEDGSVAATGHKQAFCLMDFERWSPTAEVRARYTCDYQGIQAGWADTYAAYLDCQWIDITDVPGGTYTIEAVINPEELLPERDYSNNLTLVTHTIPDLESPAEVTDPCPDLYEGEERDCGWALAGNQTCTPGETVSWGCEDGCSGGCVGDPVMRVCDGPDNACTYADSLGNDDDERDCNHCPVVTITCPTGGVVTVLTGEYASTDGPATCEVVPYSTF